VKWYSNSIGSDLRVRVPPAAGRTDRVEFIERELLATSPASAEHDDVTQYLNEWSNRWVADRYRVFIQTGLRLLKSESMLEPDIHWVDSKHRLGRPTAAVVPVVVEVSISSLDFDQTVKQRLYASEGIDEYWILDTINQRAVVHLNPDGDRYLSINTFGTEHSISPRRLLEAKLDLKWLFIE